MVTWRVGRRAFDGRVGATAGLATAFCGPLVFYECDLVAEGWAAFWSVGLMLLLFRGERSKSRLLFFAIGLCGALAILTRPTFLPFVAVACLWIVGKCLGERASRRAAGGQLACLCLGFILAAGPVSLLFKQATGRLGILPLSGGLNAYIGNNADRCSTLNIRPATPQWDDLIEPSAAAGCETDDDQSRWYYRQVREFAADHPVEFVGGLGEKTMQFFSSREIPRNEDVYAFRESSGLLSLLVWKAGNFGFPSGLLVPLAVTGALLSFRRAPAPLILFVVLYPLAVISVFVSSRYRVPALPLLLVLAAAAAVGIVDRLRVRRWGSAVGGVCLAAGIAVVSSVPGPFCEEGVNYAAELRVWGGDAAMAAGDRTRARGEYEEALRLDGGAYLPRARLAHLLAQTGDYEGSLGHWDSLLERDPHPRTYVQRGDAHLGRRDSEAGLRDYNRAIELRPDLAEAYCRRGLVYREQGRLEEARRDWERALAIHKEGRAADQARAFLQQLSPARNGLGSSGGRGGS